jgi:hypothetical protein
MNKNGYIGLFIVTAIQIVGLTLLWNKIAEQQGYVYMPTASGQETTAGAPIPPITVTKFPTESVLRETAQTVLKQELDPYVRQLAAAPEATQKVAPVDPPNVKENSTENLRALQQANGIVDLALANRVWTGQDNMALLRHVVKLTSAQRSQLMQKLYGAINRQELRVTGDIPAL